MARIFLSYAHDDQQAVLLIHDFLEAMGHDAWIDVYDLPAGSVFAIEIAKEIERSDYIVLCMSVHSVDHRGFVQAEQKLAVEEYRKVPEGRIFLIPIRLDDCVVPHSLRHLTWIDNFKPRSKVRLLEAIVRPEPVHMDEIHQRMRDTELFSPKHELGRREFTKGNYAEAERLACEAYNEIPNPHSKLNEQVAAYHQDNIRKRELVEWVYKLQLEGSGHGQSVLERDF